MRDYKDNYRSVQMLEQASSKKEGVYDGASPDLMPIKSGNNLMSGPIWA
jgi:hypothetical protein